MLFTYIAHWRACRSKQTEREQRIASLGRQYHDPLTPADHAILEQPIASLVAGVHSGSIEPLDILTTYGKKAIKAHAATNCLTEIMISAAEKWATECNRNGPLAGVPVSLKDTVNVIGFDSCIGYSAWVGRPATKNSALVRLLLDAGAIPYVKTNIPITLLSYESYSDVWGRTTNPYNKRFSPGGSTGGEAALIAYGGSRIGIGTDVAGSVRVPSHYCGIYTIRASTTRFPRTGNTTSMPGQDGVPAVYSPMARTLEDLETFWKAVVSMEPWKYDPSCIALPWRATDISSKTLRWGVIWDDGVVAPSPACKRALQIVVDTLNNHGHETVTIHPPDAFEGMNIASRLLLADAGKTATKPIRWCETNDAGVTQSMRMFALPRWIKKIYAWYLRYIRHDTVYAKLIEGWHEKTIGEYYALIAQREDFKRHWFEMWQEQKLDFVLSVPNPNPSVPHNGMKESFSACEYALVFNLLDYSAGVLPVTHVDATLDKLPTSPMFKPRNAIERGSYKLYDAAQMNGLPVGVQVVGQRLEEEKVLEGMKIIEALLKRDGKVYDSLRT